MVDRFAQKKECEKRLKMLGLHPDVLKLFREDDKLYYSERTPLGGILYWMDNNPDWVKLIKSIEDELEIMVYHATHEYTEFGECLSCLYVSKHKDDWEYDRKDLDIGTEVSGDRFPLAYVINLSFPELSEFGSIGVREKAGGLVRTA